MSAPHPATLAACAVAELRGQVHRTPRDREEFLLDRLRDAYEQLYDLRQGCVELVLDHEDGPGSSRLHEINEWPLESLRDVVEELKKAADTTELEERANEAEEREKEQEGRADKLAELVLSVALDVSFGELATAADNLHAHYEGAPCTPELLSRLEARKNLPDSEAELKVERELVAELQGRLYQLESARELRVVGPPVEPAPGPAGAEPTAAPQIRARRTRAGVKL